MSKMLMQQIEENKKKQRIVRLKQLFAEYQVDIGSLSEDETNHLLAAVIIALR